ncbi:MAG: hypothetical protein H7836_14185 [Magnetococcus sp. YQC-3]
MSLWRGATAFRQQNPYWNAEPDQSSILFAIFVNRKFCPTGPEAVDQPLSLILKGKILVHRPVDQEASGPQLLENSGRERMERPFSTFSGPDIDQKEFQTMFANL